MKSKSFKKGFIFPKNCSVETKGLKIDLPRDAYILYIESKFTKEDKAILRKGQEGDHLNDSEYIHLIKNSLRSSVTIKTPKKSKEGIEGLLENYGLQLKHTQDEIKTELIDEALNDIKCNVYDSLLINILQTYYIPILESIFPNRKIYLGPEASEANERLQSLNTSLRIGFLFTLISFLYGKNSDIYDSFHDFFNTEFEKRTRLVKNILDSTPNNQKIKYIPIYENFKNYNKQDTEFIMKTVRNIFDSDEIQLNNKNEIENQLIRQAQTASAYTDSEIDEIRSNILQPIVSYTVNLNKAELFLQTAFENFQNKQFDSSINRCYYSMMRSLRALLAEHGILKSWRENTLNPRETHSSLENKLKSEIIDKRNLLNSSYFVDFVYVKEQRMLADYNELYVDSSVCQKCLEKANRFFRTIKAMVKK
ncbi:HEPN domain-containing protein [candidate division KSB1 bacterium]